VTSTIHKETRV